MESKRMGRIIKAKAWQREDTVTLACELLGKALVRKFPDGSIQRHVITEVEAYDGELDLASHARAGRTGRTEVMYAAGGIWYVYLCYGIHEMLNLVVGAQNHPKAILIRGLDGISGPGRLTKQLQINRGLNGRAAAVDTGLWLEDIGLEVPADAILATPRIGVDFAGPLWSQKPWRFILNSKALSSPPTSRPQVRSTRAVRPA